MYVPSLSPLDILYTQGFLLRVLVMRDSITARSTHYDLSQQSELCSWLCEWYLLLSVIARVEIEIVDHVWNMEWPGGVTYSTNIGEIWWSQLQRLSCASWKNLLQEDEHTRDNQFPREKGMVSEVFWMLLLEESLEWFSLRLPSGGSDNERHMSWS